MIQRISLFRVHKGKHSEEAEETADEVFSALWRDNCHLLRGFDPAKGNLENYLTAVVKHIAEQDERLKQRERGKLKEYKRRHRLPGDREVEESPRLTQEEFAKRLKGELKRYFLQEYLGRLENGEEKKVFGGLREEIGTAANEGMAAIPRGELTKNLPSWEGWARPAAGSVQRPFEDFVIVTTSP